MSHTQLMKKWERESRKQDKLNYIARTAKNEVALKRADDHFVACIKEEEKERMTHEKRIIEINKVKDNIMSQLRQHNPFSHAQFIVIWDILTGNYDQIKICLDHEKISKSDILTVFKFINDFSTEIINKYWHDKLVGEMLT